MNRQHLSDAEQALFTSLRDLQDHAASIWQDREKEGLIALVRALDSVATASYWDQSSSSDRAASQRRLNRAMLRMGTPYALRPLLSAVRDQGDGVPLAPTHQKVAEFSYAYLLSCGQLVFLSRLAALERYGLARTERIGSDHIRIEAAGSAPEQALLSSLRRRSNGQDASARLSAEQWKEIHARMRGYVDVHDNWFIRYENDWEIVMAYREKARSLGQGFLEAEALPDDVRIGDRCFGEWKDACEQALGRVLAHMDFAAMLKEKRPSIALHDVLTIFARREDVEAVWEEAGLERDRVPPTMRALTLAIDGLDDWERAYETPTSFYVDLGKNFVLLPCFGALTNPYFALFRHLRSTYRKDWDSGVDRREAVFRADLARAFPAPRFMVPLRGYRLYRLDGSMLTDVDAVIVDMETGSVVLAQLKWHDVFGFSLAERESRRRNIGKANEWVERIWSWVDGRTSAEILRELRIEAPGSDRPPLLYVIARYAARFAGDRGQDQRASWLGWQEILHAMDSDAMDIDPLSQIPTAIHNLQAQFESPATTEMEFQFRGLRVTLQIRVSHDQD
ncbi:hypothetical protein HF896_15405 [Alicycliphilus denitrificans]|uniref:Uncharacterized protein n=1 Tax=Alicycliphilus denitrificans TaxID=179636 RepID=A0A858ZVY4_9BURK|nr:hypothetical protein [Alicycliphilus denitrificans]QKD44907.1 hypothetical protein HF896_15405 [Alicycliphilus denitrificans]